MTQRDKQVALTLRVSEIYQMIQALDDSLAIDAQGLRDAHECFMEDRAREIHREMSAKRVLVCKLRRHKNTVGV